MLTNPTLQRLTSLHLGGMAEAYEQQLRTPVTQSLTFDERFGMLVDAEHNARENRRTSRMLKQAKLKASTACAEDIEFSGRRGMDRAQVASLLTCDWIQRGQNVAITGPTGTGKTWLGCALGREAARKGMSVVYERMPRLLEELAIAHMDGSLPKMRARLAKPRLLILDDWGSAPITPLGRQDIFEIMEDRYPTASVLITSQLPTSAWHEYLGEPTVADATLDRILHNCHLLELKGESMRRRASSEQTKK
ncbi:IS21-like element helper ATPase IstB [Thermomonas sp. LB-4]|uniref:IS21-like element helper ATPase IstB n=1 Tax=Thermomonas sp. LB-4 TaxID=3102790 RepID=UPI002ED81EAD